MTLDISSKGNKELKRSGKCNHKNKENKKSSESIKIQYPIVKRIRSKVTKESNSSHSKEKSKFPEQNKGTDNKDSQDYRTSKEKVGEQTSLHSELVSIKHVEKKAQHFTKWKKKKDTVTVNMENDNREVSGQNKETLCNSDKSRLSNQSLEQGIVIHGTYEEHKERCYSEDRYEESTWNSESTKGLLRYTYQKVQDGNKETEKQTGIQNNTTKAADYLDIGEAENDMLFSSPKVMVELAGARSDKQDFQQLNINTPYVLDTTTPNIEGASKISKFWQTPDVYPTSPFTQRRFNHRLRLKAKVQKFPSLMSFNIS